MGKLWKGDSDKREEVALVAEGGAGKGGLKATECETGRKKEKRGKKENPIRSMARLVSHLLLAFVSIHGYSVAVAVS